jgi:retron-type reverse transcriptase
VDFDIASFFESINLTVLFNALKARITEPALRQLLRAWLNVETVVVERTGVPRKEKPRGILQGGVLSPLFGNVYLDRFDKLALKQGLKLIRYGDDIVVCCRSKREAETILKLVAKLLAKLDLRLNPHKTVIVHAEKGFHFLGERLFLKTEHNGEQRLTGWRSEAPQRVLPALLPASPRPPARLITDEDDV